jgi:hypothetical protein
MGSLKMRRPLAALSLATALLWPASLFAPIRAEGTAQTETPKTNFRTSPITPGFWQFSSNRNADSAAIAQACRDYVTFQFQDGYYFTLSIRKNPPHTAEPRLSAATVHEVGHCTFDRKSQSEHCAVAVTDDGGTTNNGFIDIRYSTEGGTLKMSIKAAITGGPNSGQTESFDRFPVKCPDNVVHDLMTPSKQ